MGQTPKQRQEQKNKAWKVWYEKNKQRYNVDSYTRLKIRRKNKRKWLNELKSTLHCLRCNFNHPAALQFHHRDSKTKEFEIGEAIKKDYSRVRILAEIKKCDVLCANCHAIEHCREVA